jgi:transcriptional regulator with PAS, ATPase and Fis domain
VEGAFTGAKKGGVPGAFEQANGGTIFLDEISEMDPNLQTKLLRVLQEREVVRIGGVKPIRIDVRVIASTNKDLTKLIEEGSFRSDLYYRLNVIQIKVPPLRERISDIPLLVNYFIRKYNTLLGKYVLEASQEALQILQEYNWPGNVRELQNCIENALNMTQKDEKIIYPHHLPPYIQDMRRQRKFVQFKPIDQPMGGRTLDRILAEAERDIIKQALLQAKHVKKEAATLLGISTTTLWRKMVQYQLQD